MRLKDKVSIVTGAGKGIGRSIALALAKEGSQVAVVSRTEKDVNQVVKEISDLGGRSKVIIADVSIEEQAKDMVRTVIREFGKIDILVNNAGVSLSSPIMETKVEDWDRVIGINLRGIFLCSKDVMSIMVKQKIKGTIINISSMAGKKGYINQAAYCASKSGIIGFSKVLAIESRPFGIRVNVICPGGVNTEFIRKMRPDIPFSDLMQPEDVADTVIFLVTQPTRVVIDEVVMRRFANEL